MERASKIALEVIKSITPVFLKAVISLEERGEKITEANIINEIESHGIRKTEIYNFTNEIIDHFFRNKIAARISWSAAMLANKKLLDLFEKIGGFREKYNIIIDETVKAQDGLKKMEINYLHVVIDEMACKARKRVHEHHEKRMKRIKERRKQKTKKPPQ